MKKGVKVFAAIFFFFFCIVLGLTQAEDKNYSYKA